MPIQTVGDMAQNFQSLRQTGRIKADLNQLTKELSTQIKSDLTKNLGGDTRQLASIDRDISLFQSYQKATIELGQRLSVMQTTLDGVEQVRSNFMSNALTVTPNTADSTVFDVTVAGEQAFRDIAARLNTRLADKSLFSGAAIDQNSLANADDMLVDIRAATAGMTTTADITVAINTWFDDPAGGFATSGYLGDAGGQVTRKIGPNTTVTDPARADAPAIISLLKSAAFAAVATEANTSISKTTRVELIQSAGAGMLSGADPFIALRANVGSVEARVAAAEISHSAQLTAFSIGRNELTLADPFETASRLQDVQQQLEMHYTVTARLSRLSLVNYL